MLGNAQTKKYLNTNDMNLDLNTIATHVENMRKNSLQRVVLHPPDSTLNLMIVCIKGDVNNSDPHMNVGRDEYFSVLEGNVIYKKFSDQNGEPVFEGMIGKSPLLFTHIPANEFHTIFSVGADAYILEMIGGKFCPGSTVYLKN